MNSKSIIVATMAAVFAMTAAAPSFAAENPVKHHKHAKRLIKRLDLNGDGRISRAELDRGMAVTFAAIDTNRDGGLSADELANAKAVLKATRKQAKASGQGRLMFAKLPMKHINKRFEKIDANRDGVLSQSELTRVADRMFKPQDHNIDGYFSSADFTL
jgi:EF hand